VSSDYRIEALNARLAVIPVEIGADENGKITVAI
jgi:hypothetical protein